jgi:hypothetical protein
VFADLGVPYVQGHDELISPVKIEPTSQVIPSQPVTTPPVTAAQSPTGAAEVSQPVTTPSVVNVPSPLLPNEIFDDQVLKDLDQRMPAEIPSEVQAFIDSYIAGTPVVVVVTRTILHDRWCVSVPAECECVYLGFFKVTQVQVGISLSYRTTRKLTLIVVVRKNVLPLRRASANHRWNALLGK